MVVFVVTVVEKLSDTEGGNTARDLAYSALIGRHVPWLLRRIVECACAIKVTNIKTAFYCKCKINMGARLHMPKAFCRQADSHPLSLCWLLL